MLECQFQVKYLNLKCSAQFPWQHHYNKIVRLKSKVCSLIKPHHGSSRGVPAGGGGAELVTIYTPAYTDNIHPLLIVIYDNINPC